ncbi:endospore germination permease [Metasolibacillus meyeri]|uniref:Endospore germination permease n=1 Tax=Metasolibacillus meyeri TaxID=1071052 RepID=A0AAW9NRG4_9BACL|nr:endospore germination permease [Metasolibacillus meyeri]MEC1180307.1 endospore germination permease [Metasolibacillus meyeri]
MNSKQIISTRQFTIITFLYSIGTSILIIPAYLANLAKQDAWIAATIGVLLSLLLVMLFVTLANAFPQHSFIEIIVKVLGKWFGSFIAILFILFSLINSGELLYYIGAFMQIEIMPETPTIAFVLLFAFIIIMASYLGLETFARSAEIFFPMFLLLFFFFIIFITPDIQFENVQPVLDTAPRPFIASILYFMSIFSFPTIMLLMIFPYTVNKNKSAQKGFYLGLLLGGVVLILIIALCILVLGAINTTSQNYPTYTLAQRISIGDFFQRIEVIITFMWIITIYIRTFIYFYTALIGLQQVFHIKDEKPLILPLSLLLIGISQIIHPNGTHSYIYNKGVWLPYSATFSILLPILLLLIAKIRRLK